MKEINPQVEIGLLYSGGFISAAGYAKINGAKFIHPHFSFIDEELIAECKEQNIQINTWTVDDLRQAEMLKRHHVNIIISNNPDIIM